MPLLRSEIIEAIVKGELFISEAPFVNEETDKRSKEWKAFLDWANAHVQPASIDLRLGDVFWVENRNGGKPDRDRADIRTVETHKGGEPTRDNDPNPPFRLFTDQPKFILGPKSWCLATTSAIIGLSPSLCGSVATRSTAGRWGICTRRSAGYIDPGFRNRITLEIHNDSNRMMPLYAGERYCQLVIDRGVGEPAAYDGNYQYEGQEWNPKMMLPKPLGLEYERGQGNA